MCLMLDKESNENFIIKIKNSTTLYCDYFNAILNDKSW